jgi:hypothetical protein
MVVVGRTVATSEPFLARTSLILIVDLRVVRRPETA